METCKIHIEENGDGTAKIEIDGNFMDLVDMLGTVVLRDESFRSIVIAAIVASEEYRKKGNKDGKTTVN